MKTIFSRLLRIRFLEASLREALVKREKEDDKSTIKIIYELCYLFFTDYDVFTHYFIFRLEKKDSDIGDYIGKQKFFNYLNSSEIRLIKDGRTTRSHYSVLVKDKFYLAAILMAERIQCIKTIALLHDSVFVFKGGEIKEFEEGLMELKFPIIMKNTFKEYNEGFNLCSFHNGKYDVNGLELSYGEFKVRFSKGMWVVQPVIQSHEIIRKFNKSALNATRIMTQSRNGELLFIGGFQALAVGNALTDSWGNGAIYVGIDAKKGCLTGLGYYYPLKFKQKATETHPDTNLKFDGFQIPYLREAVEICLKAHCYFPYTPVIGWDVAITNDGPLIIEGNERPGISAFQLINGGLRKKMIF